MLAGSRREQALVQGRRLAPRPLRYAKKKKLRLKKSAIKKKSGREQALEQGRRFVPRPLRFAKKKGGKTFAD